MPNPLDHLYDQLKVKYPDFVDRGEFVSKLGNEDELKKLHQAATQSFKGFVGFDDFKNKVSESLSTYDKDSDYKAQDAASEQNSAKTDNAVPRLGQSLQVPPKTEDVVNKGEAYVPDGSVQQDGSGVDADAFDRETGDLDELGRRYEDKVFRLKALNVMEGQFINEDEARRHSESYAKLYDEAEQDRLAYNRRVKAAEEERAEQQRKEDLKSADDAKRLSAEYAGFTDKQYNEEVRRLNKERDYLNSKQSQGDPRRGERIRSYNASITALAKEGDKRKAKAESMDKRVKAVTSSPNVQKRYTSSDTLAYLFSGASPAALRNYSTALERAKTMTPEELIQGMETIASQDNPSGNNPRVDAMLAGTFNAYLSQLSYLWGGDKPKDPTWARYDMMSRAMGDTQEDDDFVMGVFNYLNGNEGYATAGYQTNPEERANIPQMAITDKFWELVEQEKSTQLERAGKTQMNGTLGDEIMKAQAMPGYSDPYAQAVVLDNQAEMLAQFNIDYDALLQKAIDSFGDQRIMEYAVSRAYVYDKTEDKSLNEVYQDIYDNTIGKVIGQYEPKNGYDFFMRQVWNTNIFSKIFQLGVRAKSGTLGKTDDYAAETAALERYAQDHQALTLGATAFNFAVTEAPFFIATGGLSSMATQTAERVLFGPAAKALSSSLWYRMGRGALASSLTGFQYGFVTDAVDRGLNEGTFDFAKTLSASLHSGRDFAVMGAGGELFGVTNNMILRSAKDGRLNRLGATTLHFMNNAGKTLANATAVTGMYAFIDKPALERENKRIEAENKKISEENKSLPKDKQKPLKPLNEVAGVKDMFWSNIAMFASLDAVHALRGMWGVARGRYDKNMHNSGIHFDKYDREALKKVFGKSPNSLLRQIVFGQVDGVPAKWFEIDPEAEQEIYQELGRELTQEEKEEYATYGFTELRKVILDDRIPWVTRAKIVTAVTGRPVGMPPVMDADLTTVMGDDGHLKSVVVRSYDAAGTLIETREFSAKQAEKATSVYESLRSSAWRNNALLSGRLVIDAIEDKTYADTVDEMAREKGISSEQFEQMVFGIKQKDITGEKVTDQERKLVEEFDKRHMEKYDAEVKLTGPDALIEQVAREVYGEKWKAALKSVTGKRWSSMTPEDKEFIERYTDRLGRMGIAERTKLLATRPDWVKAVKEMEQSVKRNREESEVLVDESREEEEPKKDAVVVESPTRDEEEVQEDKVSEEEEPVKKETNEEEPAKPAAAPAAEPARQTEEKPKQGTIGFEPVEQPTERECFDAERKAKAATITDADIEANREALGIPEGTALTDEARQIYAEDLAEDLMRYERFKRGESDEKARFHDYWESKFNPKKPEQEKPVEKQEEPVVEEEFEEEEEVTEADALIEKFDNLKGRSDLDRYRNALKVFAGDDEIMDILEDLEPHDIYEWVSSFLGLDSGKGYSMLWESKTRNGSVIAIGFKEETGYSWNDVKGYAFMFDNKNGMSPRRLALKIWENLPSGIKEQYSSVDVFNIMMELFQSASRKSDLTGYIRNNRMNQVRELLRRRRNQELDEIAREKERIRQGVEEPAFEPVTPDESDNEFVVDENDDAPFSLLSLAYSREERQDGTLKSRFKARRQMETIGKVLGYKVQWVVDKPYNAMIDTEGKTLYINLRTDQPLAAVMGHEITHDLRKSDPKAYEALKRYAQDLLGQAQWEREVADTKDFYGREYKRLGRDPFSEEKAEEEVVCDAMGKVLSDKKALRELALSLDPGISGKVYRLLKDIVDKLKNKFGKEHNYDTMDSALQEFLESVEQRAKNDMPIQDAPVEDASGDFSLRRKPAPKNTGIGYKVFFLKDGKLYPPMVANIGGEATPFGVWLDADAAPIAGKSKTGRNKVKAGGKGTQGGSGTLAYRPGWHLGKIPYALQFNRGKKVPNPLGILNKKGQVIEVGEFFPNDFVWAEVEYAADKDYQEEAHGYGVNANGKYNPSLAGLPRVPEDGSYEYRTNPNPATDPWIITGAMKVNKILKPSEVDAMVRAAGREPQKRQEGAFTDEQIDALNKQLNSQTTDSQHGLAIDPSGGYSVTDKADIESLAPRMDGESEDAYNERIAEIGADENAFVDGDGQFSLKRDDRNAPTFYSNAERAVESVKQEKAKAEQWKAMLTKAGGIKAGEDKWMGLSAWLDEHKGETLTKEQVRQFVAENGIQMEETYYGEKTGPIELFDSPNSTNEMLVDGHPEYKVTIDGWSHECTITKNGDVIGTVAVETSSDADKVRNIIAADLGVTMPDKDIRLIDQTRLNYTTNGLENKREIAFVVPGVEPYQEHDEIHFGPENQGRAVMWVRFGETTDTEGNRVLVIDEIQSNRHQDAREKGYKNNKSLKDFEDYRQRLQDKYFEGRLPVNFYNLLKKVATSEEIEQYETLSNSLNRSGIPAAPFEKNWHEVAMKRMLRLAAEEGFDKIAWTTGMQQASRYNIGKVIGQISRTQTFNTGETRFDLMPKDNSGSISLFVKDGIVTRSARDEFAGMPLTDVVGKEVAQKMLEMPDHSNFDIADMDIGGEGMKGFYDDMLPRFMDKYGKKWGVKTGTVELDLPNEGDWVMHSVDVTPEMKESVMQGQPLFSLKRDKERTLMGVHNITAEKLRSALKLGGLANPSMAVIDTKVGGFDNFGEISLIPGSDLIASRTGRNAGTWGADAYSPRFPETHRRLGKGGDKKMRSWIKGLGMRKEMEFNTEEQFNDYYNGFNIRDNALVYPFLHEKGLSGEVDYYTHMNVDQRLDDDLREANGDQFVLLKRFDEDEEYKKKLTDIVIGDEVGKIRKKEGETFQQFRDRRREWAKEIREALTEEDGFINRNLAEDLLYAQARAYMENGKFSESRTLDNAEKYIRDNGLQEEYQQYFEQKMQELGAETQVYAGSDSMGRSKFKPIDLESVSKQMKKQGRAGGEGGIFEDSPGAIRAKLLNPMKTLDQIRKEKGRIVSHDEFEQAREEYQDRLRDYADTYANGSIGALADILTSRDMAETARRYNKDLDAGDLYDLDEFKDYIKKLPTEYFETKFERPVGLEEFKKAVVPDNLPLDLYGALQRAGLEIVEYPAGDKEARQRKTLEAVKDDEDVMFSLKRETRTDADGNEVYTETREDGTKDREITTYGDGSKKALWYDDKGNLKERLDYFPNGEVSQVANYDSDGNLTRNIQYDENRRITSYWLPAIGTDWKLDENGIARGKSNGVEIKPYNFQFSLKREQTHSENFKRWFGDWENDPDEASKVVDSDGRPKVVLHGTPNNEFYAFDPEKAGSNTDQGWLGKGFYFYGNAPEYASQYAGKNGRVLKVYLDIKNPYIATVEDFNRLAEANNPEESRRFREQLEEEGYDGVFYNGDLNEEWVAFRPEQIKSATENNGDFDPNNPDIRFSLKRRRNRDDYTDEDRADAAIIANTYLAQADALRQQIEADRQREHQLVEERNRLLAFEYPAADPADRPAIMDRINDLRNQINDLRNANYENNTKLRSMDYEYRVAKEILEQGAVTDEEAARFDAGQMTREEQVLESLFKAAADSRADKKAKQKAIRGLVRELAAITDNFKAAMKARGIESQRKQYDKGTVDHIIRLAKAMMNTGYIDNMTSYEVKRLMGMINNAATRESIETQAGRIVDMMLDHQIRTLRNDFNKQLKVTGQKTNSSGVQVQAGLDQEGQVVMDSYRKSMEIIADSAGKREEKDGEITEWGEFYYKTLDDLGADDPVKAEQARKIFTGILLAERWFNDVRAMEINDRILRSKIEDFKADNKPAKDADADTKQRYNDALADYQEMLRQNKIKIIEAYERITGDVGMTQAESVRRAKEFAEAQKQRVNEIQHNANSDLQDVDDKTQVKSPEIRVFGANKNNVIVRLLFESAGTYEKFMRFFGRMAPHGEGYLFKRFMTQYHHARQNYWKGRHSAFEEMDKKMAEVFGKKKMHWSDIYEMTRDHKKFPPITVSYWDGYRNGQPFRREDELNQSEALYLYMINKMPGGRMKLRKMGITDDKVQQMAGQIDGRLIQLADWLQNEFLPKMRIKYNETHKRVFGADMAAIEDYFPLRINELAVTSDMDITERDMNDNKPSTITGAIVKRRVNTKPIDLHTDAFDVALSHIDEMEHWSAYAEFNRDNNTLVNYNRFRTKVHNMKSLEFGAGKVLWKNFTNAVAIATDAYHPKAGKIGGDYYSTRVARFVSTAKVSMRIVTALKQLLSIPAFWADSDPLEQMKATVNVADTWQWAIENLPGFAERWQSRQAGNIKLANYNDLSGLRRRKAMQRIGRLGMWTNAAIDGLACALGGKAVYETKLKRYRKMGYDEARAQEKALIDAAIAYNNSQQSSEGAYVSPLQVDRTWFANAFSVFRSASMGYTRRMNTSLRQLRNATFKPGYGAQSVEFLKKQMMRDGLTEEQAEKWAHRIYRRANLKAAASVAIFGQILPFTWNLGANMFYLLFGDDDKEKKGILADSFRHSFFGPVEGLVGGNVLSEIGDIAADTAIGKFFGDSVWGDSEAYKTLGYRDFTTMPFSSDLQNVLKYFASDEVKAANEVVNILFQVATGVNPQTITDWVTAILDFSRSDMERRDIAMFAMRLLSTPQQQLDKFYLDEMNLTKEQAGKMSVDDLIKRYATYKRWRETPLTGWMYSDEREKKVEEKFQKRYEEMLEERSVAEEGLRGTINDIKDLPRKRTMMQKLQKELTDSIEATDPELYKKALEGEKADDDEYVRHVTDKDVEQMAELTMKKKALRAARDRKVQADKDAETGRITQEEYDAIYKECAHQWKLYNYLNNTLPKKLKEWKLKMEPDMQDKYTPEQVMDSIRSKTDKALQMRPEDMKLKKGDKKKVKKNKKK